MDGALRCGACEVHHPLGHIQRVASLHAGDTPRPWRNHVNVNALGPGQRSKHAFEQTLAHGVYLVHH